MKLRAWRVDEAEAYVTLRDGEVFRWTTEVPSLTIQQARASIELALNQPQTSPYPYALVDVATDQVMGNFAIQPNGSALKVSYWLASQFRGNGFTEEALKLVLNWAALQTDADQVVLEIALGNVASRRVAERTGFALARENPSAARYAQPEGRVAVYVVRLRQAPTSAS